MYSYVNVAEISEMVTNSEEDQEVQLIFDAFYQASGTQQGTRVFGDWLHV